MNSYYVIDGKNKNSASIVFYNLRKMVVFKKIKTNFMSIKNTHRENIFCETINLEYKHYKVLIP